MVWLKRTVAEWMRAQALHKPILAEQRPSDCEGRDQHPGTRVGKGAVQLGQPHLTTVLLPLHAPLLRDDAARQTRL